MRHRNASTRSSVAFHVVFLARARVESSGEYAYNFSSTVSS
jgi:hypothetical protein